VTYSNQSWTSGKPAGPKEPTPSATTKNLKSRSRRASDTSVASLFSKKKCADVMNRDEYKTRTRASKVNLHVDFNKERKSDCGQRRTRTSTMPELPKGLNSQIFDQKYGAPGKIVVSKSQRSILNLRRSS
jgi:hypothetical protein